MRFASEREYQAAVDYVHQLGLHTTAARTKPQNGSTSFPPVDHSATGNRPLTATGPLTSSLQTRLHDTPARPFSARSRNVHPLSPPVYFPRPDTATSVLMNDRFAEPQPFAEDAHSIGRPSTSDLPPRRELPFTRPDTGKSGDSDAARSGSRPSSSLMGPPQRPTSRVGRQKPSSRAGSSHGADLAPLPKPTPLNKIQASPQTNVGPRRQTSNHRSSEATRPQSAVSTRNENQRNTSFPPLFRPVTSDSSFHGRTSFSPVSEAAQNARRSEPSSFRLPTPLTSEVDHQTADVTLAELAVYAKQSDEIRMDALNNFLLKHLENDDFLSLVDDMDAAWARIVPGFGSTGKHGH